MIRKAAFVLFTVLLAGPALARESAPVTSSRVVATLITDADSVQPGQPLQVALRLRIRPGWHTYWSNPGDAGAPPELHLDLSEGASATGIIWPTPLRLPEGPVMAYGYNDEVVLPVVVTPGDGALGIKATASWLVCEKICVPEEGTFEITLPTGRVTESEEEPLFTAAAAKTARPSPFAARIAPDGTLTVAGSGLSPDTVSDAWFFPSDPDVIDQDAIQPVRIRNGSVQLSLKPAKAFRSDATLTGIIVLKDRGGNQSNLALSAAPGPASAVRVPIWQAMVLALLGGLLLNLMPCVFPVLAIKAIALARLSGQSRGDARLEAVAYTSGVIIAFVGLAALLITARHFGTMAGWGFQFQAPMFVAGMAWLLFAVGLNLSGVFAVGGSITGAGQGLATRRGYVGSFFTGLLAVLVATPCTAPFMGAAIAAALVSPILLTIAIFFALGLGLASPYLLLSFLPGFARLLPRPGAWMDVLKSVLAFPMYGAAAWLVWVVSLEAGPDGVLGAMAGLVLVAFAAWIAGLAQAKGARRLYIGAAMAGVAALALLPSIDAAKPGSLLPQSGSENFTPERLAALRAEGRPVFVNMTAAWCVTCLVNERLALSSASVRQAFSAHHVTYLKGDWTRSDPSITAYLRNFERDGVPLYVLYPGGHRAPEILPQILTETEVLDQLSKIGS
jgi:thiol:disulfide interchange protein DsbD